MMAAAARPGPYRPVALAAAKSLHEFHLAYRSHLLRPVGAVHGPGFNKNGGSHVVAAVNVVGQLVEQVLLIGYTLGSKIPKVVVGVANRDFRLQGFFRV